jgi:predicted TIM-barrel fold metal-dependent hydrolase
MHFHRVLILVGLALLAACSSEPPERWGVEVDGQWLPVIDLHTHTGEWDQMPPGFQARLSERAPKGFKWMMAPATDWMLGTDNILGQMNGAGIYGAGVFALYSPHTTGNAPNEFVAEKIAGHTDRMYGFASLRVDRWNEDAGLQLAALEAALTELPGMVGIKLAHGHQQFRFDDERFYPIYEIAGRLNKPMYLHTGTSPNPGTRFEPPYADPLYLEEAIQRYPDAVFILGHTGYDSKARALTYTDSAIYLAQKYDNVYMEPGALGADRAEELIDDFVVRMKENQVLHKVIYGSDGVQFPGYLADHLAAYVAAMQRNGYTAEEMAQVLAENFVRVFGVENPPTAAANETGA